MESVNTNANPTSAPIATNATAATGPNALAMATPNNTRITPGISSIRTQWRSSRIEEA